MRLDDIGKLTEQEMGDLEGYLQEVNPQALRALRRHRDPSARLGAPERESLADALARTPRSVVFGPGEDRG